MLTQLIYCKESLCWYLLNARVRTLSSTLCLGLGISGGQEGQLMGEAVPMCGGLVAHTAEQEMQLGQTDRAASSSVCSHGRRPSRLVPVQDHSTCDVTTSVTTEASSCAFCVALGKVLHLCGDWFPHLQNGCSITYCLNTWC